MQYCKSHALENGPIVLQCDTYRYHGHSVADSGIEYRTKKEVDEWKNKDPIIILKNKMIELKVATDE